MWIFYCTKQLMKDVDTLGIRRGMSDLHTTFTLSIKLVTTFWAASHCLAAGVKASSFCTMVYIFANNSTVHYIHIQSHLRYIYPKEAHRITWKLEYLFIQIANLFQKQNLSLLWLRTNYMLSFKFDHIKTWKCIFSDSIRWRRSITKAV